MKFKDLFSEIFISLLANKVRSGLTILGIVIGIASVIAMVSIGQGASNQITKSIEGLGSNLLNIIPGTLRPGVGIVSSGRGSAQTLKNDDVEVIEKIDGVYRVSPEVSRRFQIIGINGKNTNSTVFGVTENYPIVRNLNISSGVFISESQNRSLARVAVLGPQAAYDLFGDEDPIGKVIKINKINFLVIGVAAPRGSVGFVNYDDIIYVPLLTMQKVLAGIDYLTVMAVKVESKDLINQVRDDIIYNLSIKHRVDPQNPDFTIASQEDILGTLNQVIATFTIFLASIAGISLLVGGIGIMNMMLTSVTERTREIGLRKAIGAKERDISLQFLAESVVLTLIGGIIGIILGSLIAISISYFAGISTSVSLFSIILAFGVSTIIGIIFGYYPARRASKLNPIEALRYE
ncbi:MAG: ABC transporter permease [Patescibacteria group bacterium]|nr:ABC transporter permease [Patescibacteria group bacterium]MDW8279976.1 ABC transporter permease [bacterium]